jgi:putative transposase
MSRKTHLLQSAGTFLHVYNRGVDRGTLFFHDPDFEFFSHLLTQMLRVFDISLMVYALLPNHFHLLATQNTQYSVCSYMQRVCWTYARYVNSRRKRTGHLFEGRFKVGHVLDNAALLHMSHYIHWNPVAAGLVENPSEWKYSSFREYANAQNQSLLAVDTVTSLVGGREEYIRFLMKYDPSRPGSLLDFLKKG